MTAWTGMAAMRRRALSSIAVAALISLAPHSAVSQTLHYQSGANVQPAFDGYEINPDGTLTLWFAYLNRNYEEVIDVPVGPNNQLSPGPADRGQPTHFLPRRHKSMFSVIVPKDFGTLTWSVTVRGQTATAIANSNPSNIIDRKRGTLGTGTGKDETQPDNLPPSVTVAPSTLVLKRGEPGTLTLSAKDDGLPERFGKPFGLAYEVSVFRGGGKVSLTPARGRLDAGKGTVEVRIADAGDYLLQARVDDGSGNQGIYCCWTDVLVPVKVQ